MHVGFTVHCMVLMITFYVLYYQTVRLGVFPYLLVFLSPCVLYNAVCLCMISRSDANFSVLSTVCAWCRCVFLSPVYRYCLVRYGLCRRSEGRQS